MVSSRTNAPSTEREQKLALSFKRTEAVAETVRTAIKWGSLVLIARYGFLATASLAGKQTVADIAMRFLGSLAVSKSIAYILGGGGVIYGIGQRQLRRKSIRRITKDKNDAERLIDPGRTSSELTETGTTQPGDERL